MYPHQKTPTGNFNDQFVTVPAPTRGGGVPAVGWARIAIMLHSLRELPSAVVMVEMATDERLVIDWAGRRYWWLAADPVLPPHPHIARIRMARVPATSMPAMPEMPEPLDALLWTAGLMSFPGEPAPWLRVDATYRATGWPNFTAVPHEPEHVRMTALLSRSALTVDELARAARVETSFASDFINALALLEIVVEEDRIGEPEIAVSRPTGLFARLRARWGS